MSSVASGNAPPAGVLFNFSTVNFSCEDGARAQDSRDASQFVRCLKTAPRVREHSESSGFELRHIVGESLVGSARREKFLHGDFQNLGGKHEVFVIIGM